MYAGINIMNSSRKQKEMIEVKCPAVGLVYCFLTVCIDQWIAYMYQITFGVWI